MGRRSAIAVWTFFAPVSSGAAAGCFCPQETRKSRLANNGTVAERGTRVVRLENKNSITAQGTDVQDYFYLQISS
jgi:hypothetical protein